MNPEETMDTTKTEAQLLRAMASATTQAEQQTLAEELEGLRATQAARAKAETESMWADDFLAHLRPDPVATAMHSTSSRDSDWLADVPEVVVDTGKADVQMRAEASHWYSRVLSPLAKESAAEIHVQAHGLALALSSQYGDARPAAYQAFMDQVRHHAATEGQDLSDLPDPYVPGTNGEDTQTSASDTPSLSHGDEPEDDHAPTGPATPSGDLDASTWPSGAEWNNGDLPAAGNKAARRRVQAAQFASYEELEAYVNDLIAKHPDLAQAAMKAYDRRDEAWFETRSDEDLKILWEISRSTFFAPYDDEVYEALALRGFNFEASASRKAASLEAHEVQVCTDCLMTAANGYDPHSWGYTPETEPWALWKDTPGHPVAGDGEGHFSHSACEGCGSRPGGDRFQAYWMEDTRTASRKTAAPWVWVDDDSSDDDDDDHYGEQGACIKCGADVEFVGVDPSDFEKQYGSHGPHNGWWDRGGNYECPQGGYHESTGAGEDDDFFEQMKGQGNAWERQASRKTASGVAPALPLLRGFGYDGSHYSRHGELTAGAPEQYWVHDGDGYRQIDQATYETALAEARSDPRNDVYQESFQAWVRKYHASRKTAAHSTEVVERGPGDWWVLVKGPVTVDGTTVDSAVIKSFGPYRDKETAERFAPYDLKEVTASRMERAVCERCGSDQYDDLTPIRDTADQQLEVCPNCVQDVLENGEWTGEKVLRRRASRRRKTAYDAETGYYFGPYSSECMGTGIGCDGYTEDGDHCNCFCHSSLGDDLLTNEQVKDLHEANPKSDQARELYASRRRRRASRSKTAISLTSVGVDGPGVGIGTDPSGKRVKFRLSPKDEKDLKAILFSDLAVNFSGVDVEESDIIKDASRTKRAAVGDPCWSCEGKGYYRTPMGDGWDDPYGEQMMEVTCSTCGGSGVVNEPTDYPLADDPIFTDRYSDYFASRRRRSAARRKTASSIGEMRALVGRPSNELEPDEVPDDHPVRPLTTDEEVRAAVEPAICGTCGLIWDDGKSTSLTPTPSGRCPFEYFHWDDSERFASRRKTAEKFKVRKSARRRTATASWLEAARRVVERHQHETVDGMLLDATTASVLVQVHDALGADNKARFAAMPLPQAAEMAWRLAG